VRESTTYRAILREGDIRQAQWTLLKQGAIRFGAPPPNTKAAVKNIESLKQLHRLLERVLSASNWQQLMAAD
jgi:hypothetical protein